MNDICLFAHLQSDGVQYSRAVIIPLPFGIMRIRARADSRPDLIPFSAASFLDKPADFPSGEVAKFRISVTDIFTKGFQAL